MTIDDLVAGFLNEAAAMKIEPGLTYENWNTHHDNLERYADEFGRRDRLGELVPFREQPEDWLSTLLETSCRNLTTPNSSLS